MDNLLGPDAIRIVKILNASILCIKYYSATSNIFLGKRKNWL